jgi:hypothetical protein
VVTAYERGWSSLKNSELLDVAQEEGFEVIVVRAVESVSPGSYIEVEIR